MKTIFRALIILTVLIYVIFIAKPYFDSSFHSKDLLDLLAWNGFEALVFLPEWANWIITLIWLPISLGMYCFNKQSRLAYLIAAVFFTLSLPLFGTQVFTGTEIMLYQLIATLDGIILTMAYFTSISDEFTKA